MEEMISLSGMLREVFLGELIPDVGFGRGKLVLT